MTKKDQLFWLTKQLARRWQMSPRTLERWRYEGKGPAWVTIGGHVLYKLDAIRAVETSSPQPQRTRGAPRRSDKSQR
jgi:hypothetical protein